VRKRWRAAKIFESAVRMFKILCRLVRSGARFEIFFSEVFMRMNFKFLAGVVAFLAHTSVFAANGGQSVPWPEGAQCGGNMVPANNFAFHQVATATGATLQQCLDNLNFAAVLNPAYQNWVNNTCKANSPDPLNTAGSAYQPLFSHTELEDGSYTCSVDSIWLCCKVLH
jgi:hypothetical protein